MNLREAVKKLREENDFSLVQEAIPYARFMGITATVEGVDVIGKLTYADHLIGNTRVPALHGGTLGALMESPAIFKLLRDGETTAVPKTINITVEYLRGAKATDTFARAEYTRHGRRVANVRVFAYQDEPDKPVAVATAHFLLVPE